MHNSEQICIHISINNQKIMTFSIQLIRNSAKEDFCRFKLGAKLLVEKSYTQTRRKYFLKSTHHIVKQTNFSLHSSESQIDKGDVL